LIKEYLYSVVSSGTGKTAKVDGYSMGGKTGTAQMYDEETHKRKEGSYLVSFLGFAPYDDPQLVIYCIVDQPNTDEQDHSTYAQNIVREILKEVLPYMNIYPDEELTGLNENLTISGSEVIVPQTTSSDDTGTGSDDTAGDPSPDDTGAGSDDTADDTVEAQ
jgi:stage V sporulation protein D (sporulation-specific penicillin-binding protein)